MYFNICNYKGIRYSIKRPLLSPKPPGQSQTGAVQCMPGQVLSAPSSLLTLGSGQSTPSWVSIISSIFLDIARLGKPSRKKISFSLGKVQMVLTTPYSWKMSKHEQTKKVPQQVCIPPPLPLFPNRNWLPNSRFSRIWKALYSLGCLLSPHSSCEYLTTRQNFAQNHQCVQWNCQGLVARARPQHWHEVSELCPSFLDMMVQSMLLMANMMDKVGLSTTRVWWAMATRLTSGPPSAMQTLLTGSYRKDIQVK